MGKLVYLLPRRYGRSAMMRAMRAVGDDTLTDEQYRALFHGQFSIEARDPELVKLADEYHHQANAYDRSICTGPTSPEGIMPATHAELKAITRHANKLRAELAAQALRAGFTEQQFKEAMMHHIRRSHATVVAAAARQDRPAVWIDEYDFKSN